MKVIITLITSLLLCLYAFGQNYEPSILILAPHVSDYDRKLGNEVDKINAELNSDSQAALKDQYLASDEFNTLPERDDDLWKRVK